MTIEVIIADLENKEQILRFLLCVSAEKRVPVKRKRIAVDPRVVSAVSPFWFQAKRETHIKERPIAGLSEWIPSDSRPEENCGKKTTLSSMERCPAPDIHAEDMYSFSSLVSHRSLLTKSGKTCENFFLNLYLVVGSWTHREKRSIYTGGEELMIILKWKNKAHFLCVCLN
jgi:hypothetical protein